MCSNVECEQISLSTSPPLERPTRPCGSRHERQLVWLKAHRPDRRERLAALTCRPGLMQTAQGLRTST
ncbi:hypothetical protein Q8A67_023184 [Cirrhinus molitorella]|uniref:Uncharacterized protein n=1 Tax=Cirrhinus molitorella TaxID=172907 RepID=A0AA88PDI1_9TELE|nr:hypothetical protein Q8A67_023184 [Cirrhinus molitorella]